MYTPGPKRQRRNCRFTRGGRFIPPMVSAPRGETSRMTASATPTCAMSVTRCPQWMLPPCLAMTRHKASTIAWEPPRATGHPEAIPSAPKSTPMLAVSARDGGVIACAADPAKRALAASPRNAARPSARAGQAARRPNRTSAAAAAGSASAFAGFCTAADGDKAAGRMSSSERATGACRAANARESPRAENWAAVSSTVRCKKAARAPLPSSRAIGSGSGWASA